MRGKWELDDPVLVGKEFVQKELIKSCHVDSGYRGRDVVVAIVKRRYHWLTIWTNVVKNILSCPVC
ncbi:hypothetical protein B0T10DRAFT_411121 [Thelonectria olida]|uniref:Integrase zinc-binding domain-containing protein n=1 Tax=Thelonectria olida TaxID=1576542 RepID=A0A9P8VXJ0_9HYPO|nr:hypothetical protein B0T10DRAFT_411121 [Thelonectria olida]